MLPVSSPAASFEVIEPVWCIAPVGEEIEKKSSVPVNGHFVLIFDCAHSGTPPDMSFCAYGQKEVVDLSLKNKWKNI